MFTDMFYAWIRHVNKSNNNNNDNNHNINNNRYSFDGVGALVGLGWGILAGLAASGSAS